MSDTVQQVKEKLSIVDVVSGYVKLERAGQNFKARCPFHNERTPSFFVSPSRSAYYCFGCGEKGDIFTFVERMEGLDFKGALKQLAERAGVVIRYEPKEAKDARERMFDLLEAATSYYRKNLEGHEKARGYLMGRGVAPATIERFRVGYAKPEWQGVLEYLKKKGYREAEIVAAGLAKEAATPRGKRIYDRFRGRIMFPIADPGGRVVGFSGRFFEAIPGATKDGREPAKYINSPETEIYHKSRILFGYDLARQAMRKSDFAILVEGQMDLVLSHQAGFRNTVALSGTALTGEHLALIARMTKRLVLALDADEAGIRSVGRGAHLALAAGFDLKIAELPAGKDPADLVADDPKEARSYRSAIRGAAHIVDFFLAHLARRHGKGRSLIQAAEKIVLPYVAEIESPLDRAHFVKRLADTIGTPAASVAESLERLAAAAPAPEAPVPEERGGKALRTDRIIELLFALFAWLRGAYGDQIAAARARTETLLGEHFDHFASQHEQSADALALMAEAAHDSHTQGLAHLEELLHELEKALLKEELERARADLAAAEAAGDAKQTEELLGRSHELSMRLKAL